MAQHTYPMEYSSEAGNNLFRAIRQLEISQFRTIVEQGADINEVNVDGYTPLTFALRINLPLEGIRTLLEVGADPCLTDRVGSMPLVLAIELRNTPALQHMLNFVPDINMRVNGGRDSLSTYAASYGNYEAVEALFNGGISESLTNEEKKDVFLIEKNELGEVQVEDGLKGNHDYYYKIKMLSYEARFRANEGPLEELVRDLIEVQNSKLPADEFESAYTESINRIREGVEAGMGLNIQFCDLLHIIYYHLHPTPEVQSLLRLLYVSGLRRTDWQEEDTMYPIPYFDHKIYMDLIRHGFYFESEKIRKALSARLSDRLVRDIVWTSCEGYFSKQIVEDLKKEKDSFSKERLYVIFMLAIGRHQTFPDLALEMLKIFGERLPIVKGFMHAISTNNFSFVRSLATMYGHMFTPHQLQQALNRAVIRGSVQIVQYLLLKIKESVNIDMAIELAHTRLTNSALGSEIRNRYQKIYDALVAWQLSAAPSTQLPNPPDFSMTREPHHSVNPN